MEVRGTMASEATTGRTQREIWSDLVGEGWVRHQHLHDRQAEPFGDAALDAIGSVDGAVALDVGCGTGATTHALADRGAREVLGVDLSVPMITAARTANTRRNVRFEVGDVLEIDRPGSFDVVFSRFGVMFFDEPVAAFAHLRSLARPRARLGFCCWGPPAENPWMTVPVMATIPVLGPPALAGPGEPGPFSLAERDVIVEVLGRAGWTEVRVDERSVVEPHPAGGAAAVARVVTEFAPPIVEGLLQHPNRGDDAREAIADALRPFERDGVVHLPARALIVTAHA